VRFAVKLNPHRPRLALALGLRAGRDGFFILSQTAWAEERCFSPALEVYVMFSRWAKIVNRVLGFPPAHRRAGRRPVLGSARG
jgi:hypothetical protein